MTARCDPIDIGVRRVSLRHEYRMIISFGNPNVRQRFSNEN
jgi:hypothetical protein